MGFNLKMFFEELLESLEQAPTSRDNDMELRKIIEEVKFQQNYALECGQIDA